MSRQSSGRTLGAGATLESLKKEAKRWLKALREHDALTPITLVCAEPRLP